MRFRAFKSLFFLGILFASFHLFYGVIYENHLGEGTDSDVLYPYLFARDIWMGTGMGWNLPPSTTLFPDIILSILLYPITGSVESFHLIYGFFVFLLPFAFAQSLGLKKTNSYLVSLGFLVLAGLDPNQLGQFFFPSFHGMTFLFAAWVLYELKHWKEKGKHQSIRFLFLMTMIWLSEYWFFVNIAPFLFVLVWIRLGWKSLVPFGMTLFGFFLSKIFAKGFSFFGIGIIKTESFELIPKLKSSLLLMIQNPSQSLEGILASITKDPLIYQWWERYLVIGIVFLMITSFRFFERNHWKDFLFFLSPFVTIVFLYLFQIEPNIRYLYILPFGFLYFSFRLMELNLWFQKIFPTFILVALFIFYLGKHSDLITKIKSGEAKRTHRIECLMDFDPNVPGASSYWPIKYIYTFSDKKWTLVPFTKDGVYYPWVANTTWDGSWKDQPFPSFPWGVTESKENLQIWPGVELVKECEGWYFFQRKGSGGNNKPKN
ncbi:hypothetical protein EHQ92_02055 [Leptospira biflexa]|uniref:hypothetical protein n=1 Tax=Leptospira biflexa TaxID=172 RepID=UPI00109126F7|nr:hypothetical protein [Leptospira biflexa]TGM46730.1 hypothetical protein EHQ92_02055 [Leptospira biflexa]TGM50805.1 hypothetical protein EHQ88_11030 [Leptospira biflexa]